MSDAPFRVDLIDDDSQVRTALSRVLSLGGFQVRAYADAESFLVQYDPEVPGCAIIDLDLPGMDGFQIQEALQAHRRPIVFLTGLGDVPTTVRAMKAGALDFLEKPVDAQILLAAVRLARRVDEAGRRECLERLEFEHRLARLTPREGQVLHQVVAGRLNKQIAGDLGTVEKTVKVHRGRMMTKMGVRTVADLVRMVEHFHA
jgi:FixJ family two-component response regulator